MNAETKAALERAAALSEQEGRKWGGINDSEYDERTADAALIRAHIASEASAYEAGKADAVAKVVAWLRQMAGDGGQAFQGRNLASQIAADNFAKAIASGAHERNGDAD
jgi:hypothetical protein